MNYQNNNISPLISLEHISIKREERQILENISFVVNSGDFIVITGPNGGGKTTLLRIMLKLLKPDKGCVDYKTPDGQPLSIGYLPQKNHIDSHFPITVREVIASGLASIAKKDKAEINHKVDEMLTVVDMMSHQHQPIGTLSGGQLQRALLGRAIISQPKVLILDEPLSYIDKKFESRFYDIIADLSKRSTIVLVSHEMTILSEMATRHLIVDHNIHECTAHHHYVSTDCE